MKRTALKRRTPLRTNTRLKKQSTVPISKLKKQLWQLCRAIIIGKHGRVCYTCPNGTESLLEGANCQVGHFIPSSICSGEMRYYLDNLRPQCFRCNIHLSGNWPAYEAHLRRDGIDVEELKRRNEQTKGLKYDIHWYRAKIAEYETIAQSQTQRKEDMAAA